MRRSSSELSICTLLISKTNVIIKHVPYYKNVKQTANHYENDQKRSYKTQYILRSKTQTMTITYKTYYDRYSRCPPVSIPGFGLHIENIIDPAEHSICRLNSYSSPITKLGSAFTTYLTRSFPMAGTARSLRVLAAVSYEIWGWERNLKNKKDVIL